MSASVRLLCADLDAALKPLGMKSKFVQSDSPDIEDDTIEIRTNAGQLQPVHVQVNSLGAQMFNVVHEADDGFTFFPQTSKRPAIVAKVKELLA